MAEKTRAPSQWPASSAMRQESQPSAVSGAADANFSTIVGLDAAGGWHVMHLSPQGALQADAAAMRVMQFFFPDKTDWIADLPAAFAHAFLETKDWGMTRAPRSTAQNLQFEREGMTLSVFLIANASSTQVILRIGFPNAIAAVLPLTGREQDIASLVAVGKTNIEIGLVLSISARTVQKHLENIFRKLGVESRMALAMRVVALQ